MNHIEMWKSFDGLSFDTKTGCDVYEQVTAREKLTTVFELLGVIMRSCKGHKKDCTFCALKEDISKSRCPLIEYADVCKEFEQFVKDNPELKHMQD